MNCIKIFSNNAVSTVMPDGREAIALGKGIGFSRRPGDPLCEELIEKVYYVQNDMQTKFLQMLRDVRRDVMDAAEEILALAEHSGFCLSNQATISLIDHISFAISRQQENISLPNLLLSETRMLYRKEYDIGTQALRIIQHHCGVQLPEDEAGYIALHLVTISADKSGTYDLLKFVKGALEIICRSTGMTPDEEDINTQRLVTHLKFLAQRIIQKLTWNDDPSTVEMLDYMTRKAPKARVCVDLVNDYVEKAFGYRMTPQEQFYLMVHLTVLL